MCWKIKGTTKEQIRTDATFAVNWSIRMWQGDIQDIKKKKEKKIDLNE